MDSEKKNVSCMVCGSTEYVKDFGFYYCIECQTQSQELREEVFETQYTGPLVDTGKKITVKKEERKSADGEQWTTWEAYNFILRGLVDELLNLGASQKFKYTVLQLWTYYLQKMELAFTSETANVLPKIGPSFHEKDRNLVYGTPARSLRKKTKRKRAVHNQTIQSTAKKLLRKSKQALMQLEVTQLTQNIESTMDQTMPDVTSENEKSSNISAAVRPLHRTAYSKEAKRVLQVQRMRKYCVPQKVLKKSKLLHYTNPKILTRFKLLVLVYVALVYCNEKIYLSDLLRWIREGNVSYYEISHLLPDNYCIKGFDMQIFARDIYLPSYSVFQKTAKKMSRLLEVSYWTKPDLKDVAAKFLKELQLPATFSQMIDHFLATIPMLMDWNERDLPDSERRVMAIIIVILKLVLGLDGKTEDCVSSVASEMNRLLNEREGASLLFVWRDWVQYIICRKAVVIQYHYPTKEYLAPDISTNLQVYMDCWKQFNLKCDSNKILADTIKPALVDTMKQTFMKLGELDIRKHEESYFAPSTTPYFSYLKKILSFLSSEEEEVRQILSQDFTATDMEYLLKPSAFQEIAESAGLKFHVKKKSAQKLTKAEKLIRNYRRERTDSLGKVVAVNIVNEGSMNKRKKSQNNAIEKRNKRKECMKQMVLEINKTLNVHVGKRCNSNVDNCWSDKYCRKSDRFVEDEKELHKDSGSEKMILRSSVKSDRNCQQNVDKSNENVQEFVDGVNKNGDKILDETRPTHQRNNSSYILNSGIVNERTNVLFEDKSKLPQQKDEDSCKLSQKSRETAITEQRRKLCGTKHVSQSRRVSRSQVTSQSFKYRKRLNIPCYYPPSEALILLRQFIGDDDSSENLDECLSSIRNDVFYQPYSQYWTLHCPSERMDEHIFEGTVISKLPISFLWLLTECAQMLHMSKQDLYHEVVYVELMCTDVLGSNKKELSEQLKLIQQQCDVCQ